MSTDDIILRSSPLALTSMLRRQWTKNHSVSFAGIKAQDLEKLIDYESGIICNNL